MTVIVSLKIDLDASASLSELESQIQETGRAAMKEALKQAIQQWAIPSSGRSKAIRWAAA